MMMMMARTLAPLLAVLSIGPAFGETAGQAPQPSITIEGRASASVVPDTAIISLGVVTERPRAADAAADNAKATQAVLDTVKANGIDAKDVQTTSVGLAPVYDTPARGPARITGFRATNTVQIRVRPVERAGQLAGTLIDKGANSIEDIAFVASPDAALQDRLRAEAMRDARQKAEVFVEAAGVKLGRIMAIVPNSEGNVAPRAYNRMAAGLAKEPAPAPVPIAAGAQDLQAEVSVTFALEQ